MEVIQMRNFGLLLTEKEFVFAINKNIYGPFPRTNKMFDVLLELLEDPENRQVQEKFFLLKTKHILRKKEGFE